MSLVWRIGIPDRYDIQISVDMISPLHSSVANDIIEAPRCIELIQNLSVYLLLFPSDGFIQLKIIPY